MFNIANFDIMQWTRFGCVMPLNFLDKHLVVAVFPFVLFGMLLLLYLFPKFIMYLFRRLKSKSLADVLRNRMRFYRGLLKFWKLFLFTIFLIYPTVSSSILKFYSCREVNGVSYLTADFRVRCDSSEWKSRVALNILFTILFPLAIPIGFATLLYFNRQSLDHPKVLLSMGFLYAAYHRDIWWFEIVDIVHKLALTSLLVFVPLDYRLQIGIIIVGFYLMLSVSLRPYVRKGDDRLHLLILCELLLMLIGGYVYRVMGKIDSQMDWVLSIIFILLTFMLLSLLIIQIITLVLKMARNRKKNMQTQIDLFELEIRLLRSDKRFRDVSFVRNPISLTTSLDLGKSLGTQSKTLEEPNLQLQEGDSSPNPLKLNRVKFFSSEKKF